MIILGIMISYGVFINYIFLQMSRKEKDKSFVNMIMQLHNMMKLVTLVFFCLACLRKIIFNQILFVESSTYFHDLFFLEKIKVSSFMYIFACVIFAIDIVFLFNKKIKNLFSMNFLIVFLFFTLTFFCISYLSFGNELPVDSKLTFQFFNFDFFTVLQTMVLFMTLLDKFDISIDICSEINPDQSKSDFQIILYGYSTLFVCYSVLGTLSYLLLYNNPQLYNCQNIFNLFPKERHHLVMTVVAQAFLMIGFILSNLYDLIPFIKIMDQYLCEFIRKEMSESGKAWIKVGTFTWSFMIVLLVIFF